MLLAATDNPLVHIVDRPWRLGGVVVPWMSSQIAVMILVGLTLAIVLPLLTARRRGGLVPRGAAWIVDLIVVFVRRWIVQPAMGDQGDRWTPYLATLMCFLLGCNLAGLLPLLAVSELIGAHDTPVGGTATSSLYVCGAMAAMTLFVVLFGGWWQSVHVLWKGGGKTGRRPRAGMNLFLAAANGLQSRRWPLAVAAPGAVVVWLNNFVPPVPGVVGMLFWPFLLVLEWIGYVAKCFALCIRLFVNMLGGHILLVVLIGLAAAGRGWPGLYSGLPAALGVAALMMLEALVAVVQAYIFTLLSAVFVGLATNPKH